jgi:hypothetical protein
MDATMQPAVNTSAPTPTLEPVHLVPPPGTSSLPDVSQVSGAPEAPVTLVPPSQSNTASQQPQQRYLPDSRYANRQNQDGNN